MYEQVENPKENESRAVANSVGQKKSNVKQGFGFVDNRPESVVQGKLQEMAKNRSHLKQLHANQEMADISQQGDSAKGKSALVIQRNPIKDQEGDNYHDSNFPEVRMTRLEGDYPYKYSILNAGQYQGAIFVDEDGDYYYLDEDGESDYERPFNLQDVVLADPNAIANIDQIQIGQPGYGVVAGQGSTVTLRTSGLNSCIAWLLYNQNAAYMEHILVGDPRKVKSGGISAQIAQIQAQFAQRAGGPATDLHLHVDESHPAYTNTWPIWFKELIPSGLTVHSSMGAGNYSHVVPVSQIPRTVWRCAKISLQYEE